MTKYIRKSDNIASKIQDEIVMVNVTLGNYFSMNAVASSIWELLEKPQSIDALCSALMEEYAIDLETCQREVHDFIAKLTELNVIETVD